MFAYCINNPIVFTDSIGENILEDFLEALGQAIKSTGAVLAFAGGTTQLDGPLLGPADLVGAAIVVGTFTYYLCSAMDTSITYASAKKKTDTKTVAITTGLVKGSRKKQAIFPSNPYTFSPRGLEMKVYVQMGQGKNGGIIKWEFPGTGIAVFEWNEDRTNGSHYHIILPGSNNKHDGTHYLPGTVIPEPWQSTFFYSGLMG